MNTPMPNQKRGNPRLGWFIVQTGAAVVALGIAWCAPAMKAVHRGTSAMFWLSACQFDTSLLDKPDQVDFDEAYLKEYPEGYYYHAQMMHGTKLFLVPADEVKADFPRVDAYLKKFDTDKMGEGWLGEALLRYRSGPEGDQGQIINFLYDFECAKDEWWMDENPERYAHELFYRAGFEGRRAKLRWSWASFPFEWCYLTGLILLATWPLIRGYRPLGWALCWAPLPLAFLFPVYLGYATGTFSSAGPNGGILYPQLLSPSSSWGCNAVGSICYDSPTAHSRIIVPWVGAFFGH